MCVYLQVIARARILVPHILLPAPSPAMKNKKDSRVIDLVGPRARLRLLIVCIVYVESNNIFYMQNRLVLVECIFSIFDVSRNSFFELADTIQFIGRLYYERTQSLLSAWYVLFRGVTKMRIGESPTRCRAVLRV